MKLAVRKWLDSFFIKTKSFFCRFKKDDKKEDEIDKSEKEKKIFETILEKLYSLEQKIQVFKDIFPGQFLSFSDRIDKMKGEYKRTLEESKKKYTFEIDPDDNCRMISEFEKLEKEVEDFFQKEVCFYKILKKLQRLIKKISVLYNVSIFHKTDEDKSNVLKQLKKAEQIENNLVLEFKGNEKLLADKMYREQLIDLFSYADYLIFKTKVRNLKDFPSKELDNISSQHNESYCYNLEKRFKSYVMNETSNLKELLPVIAKEPSYKTVKMDLDKVLSKGYDSIDISDKDFWNGYIDSEEILMNSVAVVSKEKAEVKVLDCMKIDVANSDVLDSAKDIAYNALLRVYAKSRDEKANIFLMLIKEMPDDITYQDIYFLLVLFEIIDLVKENSNNLLEHIKPYISKYGYSIAQIRSKKEKVSHSQNKAKYFVAFKVSKEDEKSVSEQLDNLCIDHKIILGEVSLNEKYFENLKSISKTFNN